MLEIRASAHRHAVTIYDHLGAEYASVTIYCI